MPALKVEGQSQPVTLAAEQRSLVRHEYGSIRDDLATVLARSNLSSEQSLYLTQCAACHGVDGGGQTAAYYPSLQDNGDTRRGNPSNLVMVIAHGSGHSTLYRAPIMPGFSDDLSAGQIAEVANYIRSEFGGQAESALTAEDVDQILNEKPDLPFLIKYAAVLAWIGIFVVFAFVGWIVWIIWRRKHKPAEVTA